MGLLRRAARTFDLQSRPPGRRGCGIRFALELGRPLPPRGIRPFAPLCRIRCCIDMSTPRERLERLLGGATLAALRERLRRRYEMGRGNDDVTLTTLSAGE